MRAGRWPDAAAKSVPHPHDKEFLRSPVTPGEVTRRTELRDQRRRRQHGCWDQLIVAPLWVAYEANLGTLLRTCDAVGACMAVLDTEHYHQALDRGDTLPRRPHVHWVRPSKLRWIVEQRETSRIVAVELAEDATPLTRLAPARTRTVVLLGHERHGVPAEAWDLIDEVIEIPMVGCGASLNVAVAGSLVLYRLAGLM
jgi:tRNA (guanosine-2'-O-)-methyltransferase